MPDSIPGFVLESEIGRGGMGVAYRHLGRKVALKLLRTEDAAIAEWLLAEARAAAWLDHPGIVPIFETGRSGGRPYLAMTLVAGPTLATAGKQPPRPAARSVRDAALAVQHAHEQVVIHRDLKPGNILLAADGSPRITAFGFAKRSDEATQSQDVQVLGTPAYAAGVRSRGSGARRAGCGRLRTRRGALLSVDGSGAVRRRSAA